MCFFFDVKRRRFFCDVAYTTSGLRISGFEIFWHVWFCFFFKVVELDIYMHGVFVVFRHQC